MLIVGDYLIDTPLRTPFDAGSANFTRSLNTQPNLYNGTNQNGTLYQNITGFDIANETESGALGSLNPIDTILYPIAILQLFLGTITGTFGASLLDALGFPDIFIAVYYTIYGFLAIMTVVYFVTGRG